MYMFAVCDDEEVFARSIRRMLQMQFQKMRIPVTIDQFTESEALLERLKKGVYYDVLFMDIDMPGVDGIELCRQFRKFGGDALVVFVSNKEELVFQTFDVHPFRFIRKRKLHEDVEKLYRDIMEELDRRKDKWLRFTDSSQGTVFSVNVKDLMYVEARGKYCRLRMKQKEEEVKTGFQSLNERLKSFAFIQVHRSYCVNPDYIYQISADTVLLDQGESVPLSRRRRAQIKEEYFKWCRGG